MTKSTYFADDKDVLDLLEMAKRKLPSSLLRLFLLQRGILASTDLDRSELQRKIAMWTLDLEELNWLMERCATEERAEKFTSSHVAGSFTREQIAAAIDKVKENRSSKHNETHVPHTSGTESVAVAITYTELDPGKTRLRQKRKKEGALTVHLTPNGLSVRHESNQRMDAVARAVLDELAKQGKTVVPKQIELTHLPSPEDRTQFFLNLIDAIPGFKLVDVNKVTVHRPGAKQESEDEDSEGTEDDQEEKAEEELAKSRVRGAILKGEALITSKEFQMLRGEFYLCGLEWTAQQNGEDGVLVMFEAGFEDAKNCRGFSYRAKGVYERRKRGAASTFVSTIRSCSALENSGFVKLLEDAAMGALAKTEEAGGSNAADLVDPDSGSETTQA
ncbi:MAG: hypothetical protein NVV67_17110 [Pseudoxanthomonas sp.]|nr:hypothetical protein [Pseudoxanthomonas sp.]